MNGISPVQSGMYILADKRIDSRKQRNEDEHSDDAEQTASYTYCCKHPDGRKTDGAAHDLGVYHISLELLKTDKQHQEPESLVGSLQQYEESADKAADKCSDYRQQGGKGYQKDCCRHKNYYRRNLQRQRLRNDTP